MRYDIRMNKVPPAPIMPIIMMSQNRQEAKDRRRAEHDYPVNLKAELDIRSLNLKMDQLLTLPVAAAARDPTDPDRAG